MKLFKQQRNYLKPWIHRDSTSPFLKKRGNSKAFTLIELLVVIAVIGILASFLFINFRGVRDRATVSRGLSNQRQAVLYCNTNPGVSTLNGYTVYCDSKGNMWSETLNTAMNTKYEAGTLNATPNSGNDTWYWSSPNNEDIVSIYGVNDCNAVPTEDLHKFPACNACATLNYAGFSEGWRLPSQGTRPSLFSSNCDVTCARDNVYCAPGRQLWDFGAEQCSNWGATDCAASQGSCLPSWDDFRASSRYWSSTQFSAANAWTASFSNAYAYARPKVFLYRVRCFLGQW